MLAGDWIWDVVARTWNGSPRHHKRWLALLCPHACPTQVLFKPLLASCSYCHAQSKSHSQGQSQHQRGLHEVASFLKGQTACCVVNRLIGKGQKQGNTFRSESDNSEEEWQLAPKSWRTQGDQVVNRRATRWWLGSGITPRMAARGHARKEILFPDWGDCRRFKGKIGGWDASWSEEKNKGLRSEPQVTCSSWQNDAEQAKETSGLQANWWLASEAAEKLSDNKWSFGFDKLKVFGKCCGSIGNERQKRNCKWWGKRQPSRSSPAKKKETNSIDSGKKCGAKDYCLLHL